MIYRKYDSYEQYLEHQKAKHDLLKEGLKEVSKSRERDIYERIRLFQSSLPKGRVLCLGARLGEEVKAFRKMGFPAIGIDLNPGENNKYVEYGDFHNLQFPDGSFKVVYTNCLDHAMDLSKVISEVYRVLKMYGVVLLDVSTSDKLTSTWRDGAGRTHLEINSFESMMWDKYEDVPLAFEKEGFHRVKENPNKRFHTYMLRKHKRK